MSEGKCKYENEKKECVLAWFYVCDDEEYKTTCKDYEKEGMMPDSKVIEILEKLISFSTHEKGCIHCKKVLVQAETELLAYFRGRVPKKKEHMGRTNNSRCNRKIDGFNECRDLILKNLGAEGEGR